MSSRMLEEIPEEVQETDMNEAEVGENLLAPPTKRVGFDGETQVATEQQSAKPVRLHRRIGLLFFPSYEFTKILLSGVVPALTVLIPLFYAGQIANESALAIASQFTFVGVILKVLQDTVVNGMFYMIGRDYEDNRKTALHTLKICAFVIFSLGVILSMVVMFFTEDIVEAINTPTSICSATTQYLYVSAISFPFILVNETFKAHMLITQHILIVVASVCQAVVTLVLNVMLFGTQEFSAHWGIEHLGMYKVIESVLALCMNLAFFFLIEDITVGMFLKRVPFTEGIKQKIYTLAHVSWANFCESIIRNFFYFVVTLTFVNYLGPEMSAAWNVLNMIIWSFLLLPAFTVASQVKISIGLHASKPHLKDKVRQVAAQNGRTLTAWCLLVGAISVGIWPWLAVIFSPNNTSVQKLSYTLFLHIGWVFIVFAFSNAANGMFYGLGETRYVLYVCSITNGLVYVVPWLMYLFNWLEPTYWGVIGLYAAGIVLSSVFTVFFALILYKRIGQQQIDMSVDLA